MRSGIAISTLAAVFWASFVNGEVTSNVTCSAESSWMLNKLGQTPCLVSAYLSSVCNSGSWNVPTLTAKGPYNPPSGAGTTPCRCNSVVYSLISACSVCQGGLVGSFANWIQNCPDFYVTRGSFSEAVPDGTQIPSWSLVDPTNTGGSWNATYAQQIAESKSSSKPNIGVIVGATLGGIAVLAIIIFAIWYFMRRKRNRPDKVVPVSRSRRGTMDTAFRVEPTRDRNSEIDLASSPTQNVSANPPNQPFSPFSPFLMRPYNPDDPTTFPTSAHPTIQTIHTGGMSSMNHSTDASLLSHPTHRTTSPPVPGYTTFAQPPVYPSPSPPRTRYSGAAEV